VIGILALINLGLKKTDAFTMAAQAVTKAKVLGNCERETVRNWYRQGITAIQLQLHAITRKPRTWLMTR
jgi:hypothetical protein